MTEDVFFRPALLIFADEAGNDVYQHLCKPMLLNGANKSSDSIQRLDELICYSLQSTTPLESLLHHVNVPLRGAIGLVRLEDSTTLTYRYHMADSETENSPVMLPDALFALLRELLNDIPDYTVLRKDPQIYVVGHVQSPGIRTIVQTVRRCLQRYYPDSNGDIYYLYLSYPSRLAQTEEASGVSQALLDELAEWANENALRFCFLYENVDDEITRLKQDKVAVDYAVALSLLSLVATGITSLQSFKDAIGLKQGEAFGTLSACLIESPQAIIRTACRAYIASLLLASWIGESQVSPDTEANAYETMTKIEMWIQEGQKIPPTLIGSNWRPLWLRQILNEDISPSVSPEHYPQPDFAVLLHEKEHADTKLKKLTEELFTSKFKDNLSYEDWYEKIAESRKPWQIEASNLWQRMTIKTCTLLNEHMNLLWNDTTHDPSWTLAYIDALDQKLKDRQEQMGRDLDTPDLTGKSSEEYYRHQQYAKAAREAMPSLRVLLTLATTGLVATLVCSFLLMNIISLLPGGQSFQFPQMLLIGLFILLCIASGNILLWYRRFQTEKVQAELAFTLFYHNYHVLSCKQHDLKKRFDIIVSLRKMIACLKSDFVKQAQNDFELASKTAFSVLFAHSMSLRTIFIGDKKFFQQNAREAISIFLKPEGSTSRKGAINPRPAEQLFQQLSSLSTLQLALKEAFYNIDHLIANREESDEDKIKAFYKKLCLTMRSFVSDDRIDVLVFYNAYVNTRYQDLWQETLATITQRYLWRQQAQNQDTASFFLCGSKECLSVSHRQITEVYKREITKVYTSNAHVFLDKSLPDWLLITAFYRYHWRQ